MKYKSKPSNNIIHRSEHGICSVYNPDSRDQKERQEVNIFGYLTFLGCFKKRMEKCSDRTLQTFWGSRRCL
jgi:hypothetical protein